MFAEDLRHPAEVEGAWQTADRLHTDFYNIANGGGVHGAQQLVDRYLQTVEVAESAMSHMWASESWREELHSTAYWQIRGATPDTPRLYPLVQNEARRVEGWLGKMIWELRQVMDEDRVVDLTAKRAVVDTNVLIHHRPASEIDWRTVVSAERVRVMVPIAVVRELDGLKVTARPELARRARLRLREMQRALEGRGRGPVEIGDGVTFEVLLERPRHQRQPQVDQELIVLCGYLGRRRGGAVVLVTGDLSMRLQAESQDVASSMLSDETRLPLNDDA